LKKKIAHAVINIQANPILIARRDHIWRAKKSTLAMHPPVNAKLMYAFEAEKLLSSVPVSVA
jgi:hypothetical protein